MILDEVTEKSHPDFCSENCSVGFSDMDARHRSCGFLASRGGLLGDKSFPAKSHTVLDVVPSVSLEQSTYREQVDVVLSVNVWITDREGWVLPAELQSQGSTCAMTPERAEHLAELLVEQARTAREAMTSAEIGTSA